jgi:carboxypeptidase C (cathepsin A)
VLAPLLLAISLLIWAPQRPGRASQSENSQAPPQQTAAPQGEQPAQPARQPERAQPAQPEPQPSITHHDINVNGKSVRYTATAGTMPLKDQAGTTEAHIFYIAYTLEGGPGPSERPLTFAFNGGPGSASVWLHLGCIGPRRVRMQEDGGMPAPPYRLEDNPYTWLDQTDLVFIDPVGTGFSRAAKPELGKKFWGLRGDIESVGEFIRLYLDHNNRWGSPLFIAGESYGTTRASGLSGYLVDHGIAFNGVILISTVMNFQTLQFAQGNDLPYILFLPTYTATAWYHKKLAADLQQQDVKHAVEEAERWAGTDYTLALARGDLLTGQERQGIIDKLARYTGLDKRVIEQSDLRISGGLFEKELLNDQRRSVGRLDSRFVGVDELGIGTRPDFDPSNVAIRPPFTAAFNNYIRGDLGYKSDLEYYALGGGIGQWDWGVNNGYADTSSALRSAFAKNPDMKLFVAMGYYDLATPLSAVHYTLSHMGLDPAMRSGISTGYYEAGHMMYIDNRAIARLRADIGKFVEGALKHTGDRYNLNAPAPKP